MSARPTSPSPIEVDHFVLEVSDPVAAIDFFQDLLDLDPVRIDEYRSGTVPFPSIRITESLIIDLFPRRMWGADQRRNPNHICLAMSRERFDGVIARLREREIPITKTDTHNFGARGWGSSVYFEGPDKISIEIRHYAGTSSSTS